MNRCNLRLAVLMMAVMAALACSTGTGVAIGPDRTPFVVELPDDIYTRGDWIGAYGVYAHVLCGMRAPNDLRGGQGYPAPAISASTGDPEAPARAWCSSAPVQRDRSVLLEPNGLKRTAGSWDDGGETRPLGQGPDLHVRVSIPNGPFLLSLYFFEIDWIQYRAYRIRVFSEGSARRPPLLETQVDDFLRGKYKRFVVMGPVELLIIVERGQSHNAQVSGIFLDELSFPNMHLYDFTVSLTAKGNPVPEPPLSERTAAEHAAELALVRFLEKPDDRATLQKLLGRERSFFGAMQKLAWDRPEAYYRELDTMWIASEKRMDDASSILGDEPDSLEVRLLRYYAGRARWNLESARRTVKGIASFLLQQGLHSEEDWPRSARLLHEYALSLMQSGRRAEALPMLHAYATLCLEREPGPECKDKLLLAGNLALRAGIPLPVADALAKWQERYGALSADERLLWANLYYVGGKNGKAFDAYETVETEMEHGGRHRWLLVAMITALLREDRLREAQSLIHRLETLYPGYAEIDEARYRLGVYHYDKRELGRAKECFKSLMESSPSDDYKQMATEYVKRIERLESIKKGHAGND